MIIVSLKDHPKWERQDRGNKFTDRRPGVTFSSMDVFIQDLKPFVLVKTEDIIKRKSSFVIKIMLRDKESNQECYVYRGSKDKNFLEWIKKNTDYLLKSRRELTLEEYANLPIPSDWRKCPSWLLDNSPTTSYFDENIIEI